MENKPFKLSSTKPVMLSISVLMFVSGLLIMPFMGIFGLYSGLSGPFESGRIAGKVVLLVMGTMMCAMSLFGFLKVGGFLKTIYRWTTVEVRTDGSVQLHVRELFRTWTCLVPSGAITAIRIIGPSEEPFSENVTHKLCIELADTELVVVNQSDNEKKALATAQKLASALNLPTPELIAAPQKIPLGNEQILVKFFGREVKAPKPV